MSFKIKTILCAIDLSENSELVLMAAVREAAAHDTEVQVLHIIPSFDAAMAMPIVSFMGEKRFSQLMEEKKKETEATIRKKIDNLKKRMLENEPGGGIDRIKDIHVYKGDVVIEILNMATRLKADILVMGAHGKGITEHTFVGSVTRKVMRRIRVPVLLIPGAVR
ncbi:MAG: universal stress protein [Nitrospiraceae bacterium]|nr:MAG: universal stress protein [Nitrospiraceae bacterium]